MTKFKKELESRPLKAFFSKTSRKTKLQKNQDLINRGKQLCLENDRIMLINTIDRIFAKAKTVEFCLFL